MNEVIHVMSKENVLNEMPILASYSITETEDLILIEIKENAGNL